MVFSIFVRIAEILFGYMFFGIKIYRFKNIKEFFKVSSPMLITLVGYITYCITENAWIRRISMAYIIYECFWILVRMGEEKE